MSLVVGRRSFVLSLLLTLEASSVVDGAKPDWALWGDSCDRAGLSPDAKTKGARVQFRPCYNDMSSPQLEYEC